MRTTSRSVLMVILATASLLITACAEDHGASDYSDDNTDTISDQDVATASQAYSGSFRETCKNITYYPMLNQLCADCKRKNNSGTLYSCLNQAANCNTVTNCDGTLKCRPNC